jgi:hypothetical protein
LGIPLTPGEDGLAARLGIEFSPTHRIVFLFIAVGDDPAAAAADRPRLGSAARGRGGLPRARCEGTWDLPEFADDFAAKSADNGSGVLP